MEAAFRRGEIDVSLVVCAHLQLLVDIVLLATV